MRVAIFSGTIPSTTFIERLIVGLAESGVQIILNGKITGPVRYDSKNIKKIGYSGTLHRIWLAFKFGILFSVTKPGILLKLIKCYPNRILSGAFLNWFVRTGPIVWHNPDIFHLQWTKGCEEWIFLQQFGIKVVVSLRGSQVNISPIGNQDLANTYMRFFPRIDAFHGVNSAICVRASNYGAIPQKCHVIYSGLDMENMAFSANKVFSRANLQILSIGRQDWKKGYHIALDAVKILKDRGTSFHYHIIGDVEDEILFQIHDLGLSDEVTIEESVPFERVKTLVSASDILLMSSVIEGIPNVILEAMALGTIVVATDCGGVTEVINDGENGFVVPIRDPEAIAEKILNIVSLSDDNLRTVRVRARETIERQHDKRKMVDDMSNLYQSVLN